MRPIPRGLRSGLPRKLPSKLHGALLALPLLGGFLSAAPEFELGFSGPAALQGPPGSVQRGVYLATLNHAGEGAGVQAWTIHVEAAGGRITGIGLEGTDAEFALAAGRVWNFFEPTFGQLAFSSIELPLDGNRLPAGGTSTIARIEVEAKIPEGGGTMVLHFPNAVTSEGEPPGNRVIQDGVLFEPRLNALEVSLVDTSCAESTANVGFSVEAVSSSSPFEGIAGGASGRGHIRFGAPLTGGRQVSLYANIISQFDEAPGIHVWTFSILVEGSLFVTGAQGVGPALEAERQGGFRHDEVFDIPTGLVRFGILSAAGFQDPTSGTLPLQGTESVLRIDLEAEPRAYGDVSFRDRPWGHPGVNSLLAGTEVVPACNQSSVHVNVDFEPQAAFDFRRGDANGDGSFDIADPIWILRSLFQHEFGLDDDCLDAADVNADAAMDISDPLFALGHLFLGRAPPPAPFPGCGPSPREALGCTRGQRGCP